MINKLLLAAAATVALTGGAAVAQQPAPSQTDRQVSGATIPQRQGIDQSSVESRDPAFWVDPSRAGNLNNPESRATVTRIYASPSIAAQADHSAPVEDSPPPSAEQQAQSQAPTPETADVSAVVSEPSFTEPSVSTEVIASAPVPDTRANRARYGQPMSMAGKRTAARGN